MQTFFTQNPQFFFVVLVIIIVLMLVYILMQHSRIGELETLLNIKSATIDPNEDRFLSDDDLAPTSILDQQAVGITSIDTSGLPTSHSGYSQIIKPDPREWPHNVNSINPADLHRIPNPATFNAQHEEKSGGGQT